MVEEQEEIYEHAVLAPQSGFQTEVLICNAFEILGGGAKGGGKTACGQMFMLKGNPDEKQVPGPAISYIYHPRYRGLVIRRNYDDLEDWVSRSREIYEHPNIGGKWFKSERMFRFPHPVSGELNDGAKILVGHLAEEGAYGRYQGREFHRILIEELTQIPTLDLYTRVISCCRSTFKELRPQIFCTTNPEGPGLAWVKKRWMFHPKTGARVPPRTIVAEEYLNPITKKLDTVTRVFFPATVRDNKILLEQDPQYVTRLMALPEAQRRAYLDGDWDVMAGDCFFPEFREFAMPGEPDNALHCVHSSTVKIEPWAIRWAGCDWGFSHPASIYWATRSEEDARVYIYRELVLRFMGAYDLGVTFARQTLPDLAGMDPPMLTLWLSPDAFANRDASHDGDSTSIVSRFAAGIKTVLGPQSVYVPDPKELEVAGVSLGESEDFFFRKALTERAQIVIRRAPNQRVAGWNYMRELFSWKDQELGMASFDREYAKRLLQEADGLAKYFRYIDAHQKLATRPELPRVRIFSDRCPQLIEGIKRMTFADDLTDARKVDADPQTGQGGDDSVDSARYLLMGFQKSQLTVPPSVDRARKMQILEHRYAGSPLLWQAIDKMDQDTYNKASIPAGVRLHRLATHPSRRTNADWQNQKLQRDQQKNQHNWFQSFTCELGSKLD